jgi:cysteine desulfurase
MQLSCEDRLVMGVIASTAPAVATSAPSVAKQPLTMKGITLNARPMYLDFQATTPMDPRVLDAMLPFMAEQYGNPHSRTHYFGWESEKAVEKARQVCDFCSVFDCGYWCCGCFEERCHIPFRIPQRS